MNQTNPAHTHKMQNILENFRRNSTHQTTDKMNSSGKMSESEGINLNVLRALFNTLEIDRILNLSHSTNFNHKIFQIGENNRSTSYRCAVCMLCALLKAILKSESQVSSYSDVILPRYRSNGKKSTRHTSLCAIHRRTPYRIPYTRVV